MTNELRRAILDKHNELRRKIALGKENDPEKDPASNMKKLVYEDIHLTQHLL